MKRLIVAIAFSLHLASLAAAGMKTDQEEEGLIGPVRTVQIETARFSNQSGRWVEGSRELSASITYDVRGNKTEIKGNVGKTIYSYDTQGKRTEEVLYGPDGILSGRTTYTYDDKGKLREAISDNPNDSSFRKTLYTYDAQDRLIEQISCDTVGCFDKVTHTYDSQGNLTEETFYYPDGSSIKSRLVHTYDEQGRRIKTIDSDAHDPALGLDQVVTTYDDKGNMLETTTSYTHKISDEEDRPIPPPAKTVYTYKFDAHGNWVKQTSSLCASESGKPVCEPSIATYRTITYYLLPITYSEL